jgi:hypothetical protein
MKPTKLFQKTPRKTRLSMRKKAARQRQTKAEHQRWRDRLLFGTLGAASPVRQIDPVTGDVLALIDPETRAILPPVEASTKARTMKRSPGGQDRH